MSKAKIKELEKRRLDLQKTAEKSKDIVELRSINQELLDINSELYDLRYGGDEEEEVAGGNNLYTYDARGNLLPQQSTDVNGLNHRQVMSAALGGTKIASYNMSEGSPEETRSNMTKMTMQQLEQRGAELKSHKTIEFGLDEMNFRSITVGSGSVVTPTYNSTTLNPGHNEVSGIIDLVKSIPLLGGESYKSGFIISSGEADYTAEGADSFESDPDTDFVDITKTRITTYFELSSEVVKLADSVYQTFAMEAANTAIRKKIAREILIGNGTANHLSGIFSAPTKVIPASTDIEIAAINETTLDQLVFGYGGSENVEGGAFLILNKLDLAAFAAVRGTDGKKLYKITLDRNGNTGTISSEDSYAVPYIINSVCPALSATATASDAYCMAYGKPFSYELALFSPITVEESRDFKFKSGQICFKAEAFVGGSVAAHKGFARVKKA